MPNMVPFLVGAAKIALPTLLSFGASKLAEGGKPKASTPAQAQTQTPQLADPRAEAAARAQGLGVIPGTYTSPLGDTSNPNLSKIRLLGG
jgi:hypothetical protein